MVAAREEESEQGGYFILNGLERVVRLLVLTRRNHIFAMERPSYANKDRLFTEFGTTIRCVRADQTAQTLTLHYLSDGTCRLRVTLRKQVHGLWSPVRRRLTASERGSRARRSSSSPLCSSSRRWWT
jgi:DNA-directed RNA polymerase beta subunit